MSSEGSTVTEREMSIKPKSISSKKCQAIIARLQATADLPSSLHLLLKRLSRGLAAKDKRHISEEAGTCILAKAVRGVETALNAQHSAAQAELDGAEGEKEARALACEVAEAQLAELRRTLVERKAAVAEAAKAVEAQRSAAQSAKTAQRNAEGEVKASEAKRRRLENVERKSFDPLKEAAAGGPGGQKRIACLRKFGKEHGFHKELLTVLPAILKKQPDKRRTFDGLALHQLEVEFARQAGALETAFCDNTHLVEERSADYQIAQAALVEARELQKERERELAAAEAALQASREALTAARQQQRRLTAELRAAAKRLAKTAARTEKFRRGPLADYQRELPEPLEAEVGCSPAELEDAGPMQAASQPPAAEPTDPTEDEGEETNGDELPLG